MWYCAFACGIKNAPLFRQLDMYSDRFVEKHTHTAAEQQLSQGVIITACAVSYYHPPWLSREGPLPLPIASERECCGGERRPHIEWNTLGSVTSGALEWKTAASKLSHVVTRHAVGVVKALPRLRSQRRQQNFHTSKATRPIQMQT